MDLATRRLVDFAMESDFRMLALKDVHECKRRLIDTFACALGAYEDPVSVMSRGVAGEYSGPALASIWGSGVRTTVELASFANGVMLRVADISDTYVGKSRGHPSDVISGILAVGDSIGASGTEVVNAIVLAYDVYCSFIDAIDINTRGWDQPVYGVIAVALAAGRLLGLSHEQMGSTVSLALAPNMALAQTRAGDLAHWKGCAGGNAARNGVFAARLAKQGVTGPTQVFEGVGGLYEAIGKFDWPLPGAGSPHMITETHIKTLPVCYHGQSAALAAFKLHGEVPVDQIEDVHIQTYRTAVSMMGQHPSRWAPATRETADHSLPYSVAVALIDGALTTDSFSEARLADPNVAGLMKRVRVSLDGGLDSLYPESVPSRITLRAATGKSYVQEVRYPIGHARNPVDDAALEAKFHDAVGSMMSLPRRQALLDALWRFEQAADVGKEILPLLVRG